MTLDRGLDGVVRARAIRPTSQVYQMRRQLQACADSAGGSYNRFLLKLLAFLGKYGHQSMLEAEQKSLKHLSMYADELGKILEEEAAQVERQT